MSGFCPEWLALREPVDARSRNAGLLTKFADSISMRGELSFVDFGCGTGSNLRATALAFPPAQSHRWQLYDYDETLLGEARRVLAAWADSHDEADGALRLVKERRRIEVRLRRVDLNKGLEGLFAPGDIVTASAFFDLVSAEWIARFADALAEARAPLFTTLTYNGMEAWVPPYPADAAMLTAFHAHQRTDKGFGRAAGPDAVRMLSDALRVRGYAIETAASDWVLDDADRRLIGELANGAGNAVAELNVFDAEIIAAWSESRRNAASCVIGHADLLAHPAGQHGSV